MAVQELAIVGAGQDDTTIQASGAPDGGRADRDVCRRDQRGDNGRFNVEAHCVAGPGPTGGGCGAGDPNGLDKGITVFAGATLNLTSATVRKRLQLDQTLAQKGDAISIGSGRFSCTADVGHATLTSVKVSVYQKNGVAVRGAGSTLNMTKSAVVENPSTQIASNGIEVVTRAVASCQAPP